MSKFSDKVLSEAKTLEDRRTAMTTVIDGWTFEEGEACASCTINGQHSLVSIDANGTLAANSKYLKVSSAVLAELLRRAGWKVEAP